MNPDTFAHFMNHWTPSCGIGEAFLAWQMKADARFAAPYVMGDIEPFRDTSGRYITGRVSWREHLAATGGVEMGHSDLQKLAERQIAGVEARRQRVASAKADVLYGTQAAPAPLSGAAKRVLARLDGRPMPDRKTLVNMAIEERQRGK